MLSMDHQGHGQSEGDRAHVQSFSDYVDDVIQYVDQEAKEYEGSGIPLFLLVSRRPHAVPVETPVASFVLYCPGSLYGGHHRYTRRFKDTEHVEGRDIERAWCVVSAPYNRTL